MKLRSVESIAEVDSSSAIIVPFVDGGNVFARPSDIDLTELRGSVGFGIRWKSPLGPFRIDYGFKIHRQPISLAPPVLESRGQWWFSFGQAF